MAAQAEPRQVLVREHLGPVACKESGATPALSETEVECFLNYRVEQYSYLVLYLLGIQTRFTFLGHPQTA